MSTFSQTNRPGKVIQHIAAATKDVSSLKYLPTINNILTRNRVKESQSLCRTEQNSDQGCDPSYVKPSVHSQNTASSTFK